MNDFDYDVMQMKRLAHQAKYRKGGSKSKKCPMSTDRMTRRQWEKRCGEVTTYQMMAPLTWDVFKDYPANIKREYINGLIQKFSVTATDLAMMFGVTSATVLKVCNAEDVGITFHRGKRMNADQRMRFEEFLGNSMAFMLPLGTNVRLEIRCEILG